MKHVFAHIRSVFGRKNKSLCDKCGSLCCRHIALEIDRPRAKRDFDQLRWYLLHQDIEVFIDHEGGWYLKIPTPCRMLKGTRCGIYEQRPDICREYPEKNQLCEFEGDGEYYRERFLTETDLDRYLKKRSKKTNARGKQLKRGRK